MEKKNQVSSKVHHSKATRWLLTHDIADKKRLGRVYRLLNGEGLRLQYSVYLIQGDGSYVNNLLQQLGDIVDDLEDDLRIYALTEKTKIWGLGSQFEADGCSFCDAWIEKVLQPTQHAGYESAKQDLNLLEEEFVGRPVYKRLTS